MKRWLLLLFLAIPVQALNLTGFWYNDGNQKIARQDCYYQGYSTNSISQNWDGTHAIQYSAEGESIGGVLYLCNGGAADATNVMVQVSSLTCQGGTGIVNTVTASSMTVWNSVGRPQQLFLAQYVQMLGLSAQYYARDDLEERRYPLRFRTPYVIQSSSQGAATGATNLFTNRQDSNKFYPVGLVPMEEWTANGSSFTVTKSSSQAVWIDTWVSTSIPSGQCNGTLTVTEGVNVSTTIPYVIHVWNFSLPIMYSFPAFLYLQQNYVTLRQANDEFPNPGVDSVPPHSDTLNHYDMMFRAHGISFTGGDILDATTNNFPSTRKQNEINGSLYTSAHGYANARGYGIGDPYYVIGQYGGPFDSHWSTSTFGGAIGFDTVSSSWAFYCSNAGVKCAIYTPCDEGSDTCIGGEVATLAQRLKTQISTQYNGYSLSFMQTGDLPDIVSTASYVDIPISHNWYDDLAPTTTSWQLVVTGSTRTIAFYNQGGGIAGPDGNADEEDGYGPRQIFWGFWLKGVQMYMGWDATYFKDDNVTGSENDLYNQAVTYGGRTTNDSVFGLSGFNYSQGDGVYVWYGNDALNIGGNPYGFDGPIATWQLKMIRRGVQDMDYMTLAAKINPSATTAIIRGYNPSVLWEQHCVNNFTGGDCSYFFGDRGWSYNSSDYTNGIISLGQIIADGNGKTISGQCTMTGGGTFQ